MLHEMDLSRADLNLLVLFETVLRERHVGRAATRLHLSASAVSHGLGRLRRLLKDPVFLRTPKGVVPTARALELAAPVADVLAGARSILATSTPFDPRTSTREFTLGAPDGASTAFLLPLLTRLRVEAPGVNLRLRQLLPPGDGRAGVAAWEPACAELDSRTLDLAIGPVDAVRARFASATLRVEGFVLVSAMHISASVCVHDHESGLWHDILKWLEVPVAPWDPARYRHNETGEDYAAAHLRSLTVGHEVVVPSRAGQR